MSENPHLGTSLEACLEEDGVFEAATTTAVKRLIAWQFGEEMSKRKLSKAAMAKLMHNSRAQLDRVLNPGGRQRHAGDAAARRQGRRQDA